MQSQPVQTGQGASAKESGEWDHPGSDFPGWGLEGGAGGEGCDPCVPGAEGGGGGTRAAGPVAQRTAGISNRGPQPSPGLR